MDEQDSVVRALHEMRRLEAERRRRQESRQDNGTEATEDPLSAAEISVVRARSSGPVIIVGVLLFAGAGSAGIWSSRDQSPSKSKAVRDEGLAAEPPGVPSIEGGALETPERPAAASASEDERAGADRLAPGLQQSSPGAIVATPAPSSRNHVATGRGRARARGSWGRSDRRAARRDEAVGEPAKGGDADVPLDDVAVPPPPRVAKKRVISDDPLEGLNPPRH